MKKLILALLTINSLCFNSIKACCADNEADFRNIAISIKNLLDENASKLKTEQERQKFIKESGKLIKELPSFHNLFYFRVDNGCQGSYFTIDTILTRIAEDMISKSLNLLVWPPDIECRPNAKELIENIINVIKRVRENQTSCCVIL